MKLKDDKLKKAILSTTSDLIMSQGIDGTSTVKVAKKLQISQSNIYSYFKNKQTLLLAVFGMHQKTLIDYLSKSLNNQVSPQMQIDQLLNALIQFGLEYPQSLQVIFMFRQQVNMRTKLPTINDDLFFNNLFKLIDRYQAAGIIKNYPAQFLAEGVFSIVNNYLIGINSGELTPESLPKKAVIEMIDSFLLV